MALINYLDLFSLKNQKNDQYQQKDPILLAKYKICRYKNAPFCGGSNMGFKRIKCYDKIVILITLQQ